jgi:energy-coupling factor transport system substrate-specific component
MRKKLKAAVTLLAYLFAIPAVLALGVLLWRGERYSLISIIVALVSCLPFFVRFEKSKTSARELVVLSVMIALSVVGRLIFTPIPAFKPVSAMVIITGIAFGPVAGFMTGSMSALISNIFFGQGPWTPFQMLIWGLIGFASGLVFRRGKRPHPIALTLAGLLGGVLFSVGMDVWTTLSSDGGFSLARYGFFALSALPMTVSYAVSNVIFLLILTRPMLQKTERLRVKYGVFDHE